ncbi:MAG: hypothetical protein K8R08_05675 [Methanosarcinales archaeon]|nr:hypothetical protein [Methanosarcinales archaeon]
MIEPNKLTDKIIAEANDGLKFCPICHRQVTQHIITSKWEDVSICSCGWTSFETPAVGPPQSEFYKASCRSDMEQTIDLVATFQSKDKHRGRKMFKDHTSCFFTIPHFTNV